MFSWFKKKPTPIKVCTVFYPDFAFLLEFDTFAEIKNHFYKGDKESKFDKWLNNDEMEQFIEPYEITGLTLENGKVKAITFTENYIGGYNG